MIVHEKPLTREILLSFWKVHILHHSEERPIYGQWIADELRRHGYNISPGTLYPLLKRMELNGWLKCTQSPRAGVHDRKEYRVTKEGLRILTLIRRQVEELYREVVGELRERRRAADPRSKRLSATARRSPTASNQPLRAVWKQSKRGK